MRPGSASRTVSSLDTTTRPFRYPQTVFEKSWRPPVGRGSGSWAPRLIVGVASWRDKQAVLEAVTGWVRESLARADTDHHAVFVAESQGNIVGVVTVGTRQHFRGEVDVCVGELAAADGHERRGVGRRRMQVAERWGRNHGLRHVTLETVPPTGCAFLADRPSLRLRRRACHRVHRRGQCR
ncbi:GNAT family N-acetyltransferase [Allorhizocola rhizosphaerae]|uniref:GNAT family N-acetyltransferase n=1 Tax=Allorhizocola rhizosphaerae TaxID=1872709 RepID=UPI000E3C3D93